MLPPKCVRRSPNLATLAEVAWQAQKPVTEVRKDLSRRRVKLYGRAFPETISTDDAGFLLARSRWYVGELIRRGELQGERISLADGRFQYSISRADVLDLARGAREGEA